jgi:2-keto-3-deoxy-L-rhamnonate aldolase RhmA
MRCLLSTAPLLLFAHDAHSQLPSDFDPREWVYGPRWSMGAPSETWNPLIEKIRQGEPIIGGTVRSTDPRVYCSTASAGYDFTWVEMQHEAISWEQVSRMWRTCPGPAVPGVRIAHESEGNIQMPTDMGALILFVPTVDSVEEAERAVGWTYFPPKGRRSSGGGQATSPSMWGQVPGGYRPTWNDNVVLVMMIETLEGVRNARSIAQLEGVDGLFAAANDLSNFSGFDEGDAEYEMLVTEIVEAAVEAGKLLCGPLRWMGVRPEFNCFQAGTEAANIARGAQAELQEARGRLAEGIASGPASDEASALAALSASCTDIVYPADCHAALRRAALLALSLPGADRELLLSGILEVLRRHPAEAPRMRAVLEEVGLVLDPDT